MTDLTSLAKDIEELIIKHFDIKEERPTIGICFSLPSDFKEVHWITNVSRKDGIVLFLKTAQKMQEQLNN